MSKKIEDWIRKVKEAVKTRGFLLKLSGEGMSKSEVPPFDPERVWSMAREIAHIYRVMPQNGMIVMPGGGNIWRGGMKEEFKLQKTSNAYSDKIGIRATEINALLLGAMLMEDLGEEHVVIFVSADVDNSIEYSYEKVSRALKQGKLVVLGGGLGNPGFSTDFAAANRATSFNRGCIMMAKNGVDGLYSKDPRKNDDAKKYRTASYTTAFTKRAFDSVAVAQARDNGKVPIYVYNAEDGASLIQFLEEGPLNGTLVWDCPTTFE
ncbi:MAG: uridine monophosphate kinase [Clostridia bacterium]|nr:uridine monophosphate kinase [Clostridia bacterium]